RASIVFFVENRMSLQTLADAIRGGLKQIHQEGEFGLQTFSVAPAEDAAEIWVSVEVEVPSDPGLEIENYVLDLINRAMNCSGSFELGETNTNAKRAQMAA